jgi:hypothetical protein
LKKQDKLANDYSGWVSYKGVHKAATKLYHEQLSVDGRMLLCKVEKNGIQDWSK